MWAFGWTQVLTIVGFGISIIIAVAGFRTFERWRREKIEERRIEVGIDALAIAYEAKFVFQAIRARLIQPHEYDDASDAIGDGEVTYPIALREGQRGAYAVLKRIEAHEGFFEKVYKIEPRFLAIFGTQAEEIFASLYGARIQLESAAQLLFDEERIEHDPNDIHTRNKKRELRATIFRGPTEDKQRDEVGELVEKFRIRIEQMCRPIIDRRYGRPKSLKMRLLGWVSRHWSCSAIDR